MPLPLPLRRFSAPVLALSLSSCLSPEEYVEEADEQVYGILESATELVTGDARRVDVIRATGTLREELLAHGGPIFLDLKLALDVAAENSRDFQRQKESMYLTALALTRTINDFSVIWGGGGDADINGTDDQPASATLSDDLSASVRTTSGTRVVASFVNTFMRSLIRGGDWDSGSILSLSLTQPLLQGFGNRVVRENLTQAERDVVYAVRSFERFRETLVVDVIGAYYGVIQQVQNLDSEQENYESVTRAREQIEALFDAGRRAITDVDRARQDALSAENRLVNARNRLDSQMDAFKLLLGLPVDTELELDVQAFRDLETLGVTNVDLEPDRAVELALSRRWDYRTTLDQVEDAARKVVVAENALESILDFTGAIEIPTDPEEPLKFDFSRVRWAAGFDIDLALNRVNERNAYRTSLITLNASIRAREQAEDQIKQQVRNNLRNIQALVANYEIQSRAAELARNRVDSTLELYQAGRIDALEFLSAQESLLNAQLAQTAALVDYAVARLSLLRDLEALVLDDEGLRIDLELPLPEGPRENADDLLHRIQR